MLKNYLNLSRAQDLQNPKERFLYRCFEIFPGFLSWITLGGAFILSWLAPAIVAIFILIFDIYWLLRISYLSFHQIASYLKMKKHLRTNWLFKLEKIGNWKDIYHLIILPMYKEGIETVRPTCQALFDSNYPKQKIIVVLATEERAEKEAQKVAKQIEKEFGEKFFRFLITVHPKDLIGEIPGKGSNLNWAINQAKEKIIDPLKIPYQNIILSGFDIDTRIFPQYLACLTYYYLTTKLPQRTSYQPIPVYNNNIWQAPAFSRVIATSSTFWQMIQQERPEQLVTYSSHSMPFKIFEEIKYPSNLVSDDSRIFWKSYLHYNGDYRVLPLYYPVSMDSVVAKNLFRTIVNQYRQQRRWAWGVENIPYLFYNFLKNKKIPLREKIRHSLNILDGFWSWATAAFLIFFLGWLPLILGGEEFNVSLLSYSLPRLTGNIMTVAMIGMIVSAIISMSLLPPRPSGYSRWKNLSMVLQWLLLPITLIVFGAFPALDAQTRLMLNKPLGFWVTEKIRKSEIPNPKSETNPKF
ncbi:MAG: glycosyltransferase family 2 protein [Patescibacteria group bacterium]|nr:glycosyltransferase family 2 protein [Patescibacteria group bacterium]